VFHGAKDGVKGNSDWYHASKVHLLHLSIILDELLTLNLNIHAYVQNSIPNLAHSSKIELEMIVQSLVMNTTHWTSMASSQNFNANHSLSWVVINYQKGGD